MQQKITPFLWFEGNPGEAIDFYMSIFEEGKRISNSVFELEGQRFFVMGGNPAFPFTEAISLFVSCPTQEEIDQKWEKLSEGGQKSRCGWLKDKFGISWQIVPPVLGEMLQDKDPKKAKNVMNAMMKMDKLIIADLQKAYEQE